MKKVDNNKLFKKNIIIFISTFILVKIIYALIFILNVKGTTLFTKILSGISVFASLFTYKLSYEINIHFLCIGIIFLFSLVISVVSSVKIIKEQIKLKTNTYNNYDINIYKYKNNQFRILNIVLRFARIITYVLLILFINKVYISFMIALLMAYESSQIMKLFEKKNLVMDIDFKTSCLNNLFASMHSINLILVINSILYFITITK